MKKYIINKICEAFTITIFTLSTILAIVLILIAVFISVNKLTLFLLNIMYNN